MTLFSYFKGLLLGSTVTFLSYLFDITVSRNSLSIVLQKQGSLYKKGWNMIIFNMLGIAPIVYTIIHDNMIVVNTWTIEPVNIICILAIHSYGYYTVHKAMHENRYLYKFHKFHHMFDDVLVPSIGNAVSTQEFLSAYIFPFIVGAYVTKPSELSFIIPISLISIFNMLIHCNELKPIRFGKYMIDAQKHITHHKERTKHYAAPIVDLEEIINIFT